jgi:hypothetical protein
MPYLDHVMFTQQNSQLALVLQISRLRGRSSDTITRAAECDSRRYLWASPLESTVSLIRYGSAEQLFRIVRL